MFSALVNFFFATIQMVPLFTTPAAIPTLDFASQSSKCLNPAVRREWRTLSISERTEWIRAIKCIAAMPHNDSIIETQHLPFNTPMNPNASYYSDIVHVHIDLSNIIHLTGYFLPWHRVYIHAMEEAMKSHCDYQGTAPYWDWRQDAADFEHSFIFNGTDPISGIGGWGNPDDDMNVFEGAFAEFKVEYPYPHILKRNFTLQPFLNDNASHGMIPDMMVNESLTSNAISKLVNNHTGDYRGFQKELEFFQGPHSSVHELVGGDMAGHCTEGAPNWCVSVRTWTPSDPIFWLHHAMIDKVFTDWQNRHISNAQAFGGGSLIALDKYDLYPVGAPPDLVKTDRLQSNGMFPNLTIEDVLSTTGGYLCYIYA